ncbi:bestrophin family protein [Flavobacterium sp. 1355]|uniref:bestrophin family protein n=1 Tax=Flavobacterium sp. 1355 TaxID=2806571 RepID=UPI001AE473EF|nr:bestrophin family ion channel [Flavobacterium sp. 1355]MBP1221879.1 putative membrane protein [Flavobacterium sp. 1355]
MLVKNNYKAIFFFLKHLWTDLFLIILYASIITTIDLYTYLHLLTIPLSITTVTGTIVALLLAFRTAQSYDRWWEARKVWGEIVNESRTLIRQVKQFFPAEDNTVTEFANRQIIWCYALSESLRKQTFSVKVQAYLDAQKISANNIPSKLLTKHSEHLKEASHNLSLDPIKQAQIDSTISRLNDSMGKCERIKNTIFPRSYSFLIHFLIYVLASILPFGLDDIFPFTEIAIAIIIPLILLAVEETAIIMQDPFENRPTDVPMTALSNTIENNIMEIITDEKVEIMAKPKSFYIN